MNFSRIFDHYLYHVHFFIFATSTAKSVYIRDAHFPLSNMSFTDTSGSFWHHCVEYLTDRAQRVLLNILRKGPCPKHIAFIMDGNRRFSKQNNIKLADGHSKGAETLLEILTSLYQLNISHVTVYAFSIENFNRPKQEVDTLFELLRTSLAKLAENEESFAQVNHVKIKVVGNRLLIPEDILPKLEEIERKTNKPESIKTLNVCFPYTSRDDIAAAMKKVVMRILDGEIDKLEANIQDIESAMYMDPDSPPLDILVRTSGHRRLSDFMTWQCTSNCSIKFVDVLWPNFRFISLFRILLEWEWSQVRTVILSGEKIPVHIEHLASAPPLISVTGK